MSRAFVQLSYLDKSEILCLKPAIVRFWPHKPSRNLTRASAFYVLLTAHPNIMIIFFNVLLTAHPNIMIIFFYVLLTAHPNIMIVFFTFC